jgi:hypothetical protein
MLRETTRPGRWPHVTRCKLNAAGARPRKAKFNVQDATLSLQRNGAKNLPPIYTAQARTSDASFAATNCAALRSLA